MNQKIKEIFYLIMEEKGDEQDIKLIFNYCVKISEMYLWSNPRVSERNLNKWNLTIKDLAFESVVPLLTKNGRGKLALIQSYQNWESGINDESDIDFFLHRLVWKSTEQRLVNLIKESDPVFGKILKTISAGISQHGFKKINYFGIVYIISAALNEIHGPVINSDEFWKIPQGYFLKKQKSLLDGLMSYLSENTDYFPALPLNDLVKRIKDLYMNNNLRNVNSDNIEMIEINDLILHARESVLIKINSSYLQKEKLNESEIDKIIGIFNNISEDLLDGGINSNMMIYFEKYFPGIPKEKYYEKYQTILNYLYKILKRMLFQNYYNYSIINQSWITI